MASPQTLISQVHFKNPGKRPFSQNFFAAMVIGILLGSIAFINVNGSFGYYFLKALQVILFFAFGNLYLLPREKFTNFQPDKKSSNRILTVSILLCIALSALYFFLKRNVLIMAFSSSAAFALPFFLKLGWIFFTLIPGKEFNFWTPHDRHVSERASVSLNSLLVRLKLTQHVSDTDEKIYTVFIPHHVRLGDFFSRFLAERNAYAASSIEDSDEKKNKYAWEFFETIFYGLYLRRLEPGLTIGENKIKKDALLYIKRLKQPVTLSSFNKSLLNETTE